MYETFGYNSDIIGGIEETYMTSYNKNPQIAVGSPIHGHPAGDSRSQWNRFCRTETAILLIGLLCLIIGKFLFLRRENTDTWLLDLVVITRRDIIFFVRF